jgi:hypothetical protein
MNFGITIKHPARFTIKEWGDILDGVTTFPKFERNLEKFAKKSTEKFSASAREKKKNKYLGDAFEVFTEFFLKAMSYDNRIGITKYKPTDSNNGEADHGVDGHGVGFNLQPATVQVKYRSRKTHELTANDDHLTNFKNTSHERYGVKHDDRYNMLVVTNCKGIHHHTKREMLNDKVRCVARAQLEEMLNNHLPFWQDFYNEMTRII